MNETKLEIKVMKVIRYEIQDKRNKNGNSYAITNFNKVYREI